MKTPISSLIETKYVYVGLSRRPGNLKKLGRRGGEGGWVSFWGDTNSDGQEKFREVNYT